MYRYASRTTNSDDVYYPNEKKEHDSSDVSILSSTIPFHETEHARLRRKQRCIDQKDLKAAIKYGTCVPHYWGQKGGRKPTQNTVSDCLRYTYNDIVYIVNQTTRAEVTCYARPITLDPIPIPSAMQKCFDDAVPKVRSNLDGWTSNTVMVIDTSGSMRTSDMWGTRNRLKSVWFSVALDFLAERLESGNATVTDVISIICMGDYPNIICEEVPTTWHLYNQIAALYSTSDFDKYGLNPRGHGYFLPSLAAAEELLKRNSNAACAAALIFLSDGAPSDQGPMCKENIIEKVESLAKSFGRRLTFTAIGIGDLDDFSMLQRMVDAAKDYGATAEFKLPSMTSSSLGLTFTSVATSLTTTQTEMTDMGTLTQRKVRDVQRESRLKASQVLTQVNSDDFWFYKLESVTRREYREVTNGRGMNDIFYDKVPLQHPDARFVAISKGPFGEGAERFAYRFYEVAADGKTIVGRPLVAKESRMVLDTEDGMTESDARKQFVKTFMKTQQIARRLAVKFNDKLMSHPRVHPDTPQIAFLDCYIYELDDKITGKSSVLVENKLDHNQWHKWNSNNGMVDGVKKGNGTGHNGGNHYKNVGLNELVQNLANLDLNIIEEGSEDDEDEEDSDSSDQGNAYGNKSKVTFTPTQVAQAFSHFSYLHSDRKRLVCDLQGVYDAGTNRLQFSDPVIHYYNPQRTERRCVHGRTDRGREGIQDFLSTHSCQEQGNNLCQMVTRGFRTVRRDHR